MSFNKFYLILSAFLIFISANGIVCPLAAEETNSKTFTQTNPAEITQIEKLHQKAEDFIMQNKFRQAINVYSEILLLEPDDEVAYTNTGHIYMILGDYSRAKNAFENALHINPDNETARMGLQKIADPDSALLEQGPIEPKAPTPPPIKQVAPVKEASARTTPLVVPVYKPADIKKSAAPTSLPVVPPKITAQSSLAQQAKSVPLPAPSPKPAFVQPATLPPPAVTPRPVVASPPTIVTPRPTTPRVPLTTASPVVTAQPASALFSLPVILSHEQRIQTALKNAGLYNGPIDGKIGPASRTAIKIFQSTHGLKADGKVGLKTWAALEPYLKFDSPTGASAPGNN